jgi:predicted RNA-binding Zn ribbon-like protein
MLAHITVTRQTGDVAIDVLLAAHPALDFVGTVGERTSTRVEHLVTPADLDDWLLRADVVDRPPHADAADLAAARTLREAVYALLVAATAGRPLPRPALATVNTAAARPPVTVRLTASRERRREGDASAALASVARAALELLGGEELARVRWCEGEACTHPFLDRSRAGRRRWCGMAGCGDRAKARAYRARRREA